MKVKTALIVLLLLLPTVQVVAYEHQDEGYYIVFLRESCNDPMYVISRFLGSFPLNVVSYLQYLGPGFIVKANEGSVKAISDNPQIEAIFRSNKVSLEPLRVKDLLQNFSYYRGWKYTGKGVKVAVIDTGVNYTLEPLGGKLGVKVIGGYDFVDKDEDPMDVEGHGTAVASIIAANGSNFKGVAPDAKILAYRIFRPGKEVETYLIVEAIEKALDDGADIVNLSLGGGISERLLWIVGHRALKKGVLLVAAAGNKGPDIDTIYVPASLPTYIGVGATTSPWSNIAFAELKAGRTWIESARAMNNSPVGTVEGEVVNVNHGREIDVRYLDLKGKIAVSFRDRRTYFGEMEYNVARKGAIGLIVVNDEDISFGGCLVHPILKEKYRPKIPSVTVSKSDGERILKIGYVSLEVFRTNGTVLPSPFSSRGKDDPFLIKPDVVIYGEDVPALTKRGIALLSGTSLSTPQISGALALLIEKYGRLSLAKALSLLMLSSQPLCRDHKPYPPYVQGAGLVNITKMLALPFYLDPPYAILHPSPTEEDEAIVKIVPLGEYREVEIEGTLNVTILSRESFSIRANYSSGGYYYLKVKCESIEANYLVKVVPSNLTIKVEGNYVLLNNLENGTKVKVKVVTPSGDVEEVEGYAPKVGPITFPEKGEYWITAESEGQRGYLKYRLQAIEVEIENPPPYLPAYLLTFISIYALAIWALKVKGRGLREASSS